MVAYQHVMAKNSFVTGCNYFSDNFRGDTFLGGGGDIPPPLNNWSRTSANQPLQLQVLRDACLVIVIFHTLLFFVYGI